MNTTLDANKPKTNRIGAVLTPAYHRQEVGLAFRMGTEFVRSHGSPGYIGTDFSRALEFLHLRRSRDTIGLYQGMALAVPKVADQNGLSALGYGQTCS